MVAFFITLEMKINFWKTFSNKYSYLSNFLFIQRSIMYRIIFLAILEMVFQYGGAVYLQNVQAISWT